MRLLLLILGLSLAIEPHTPQSDVVVMEPNEIDFGTTSLESFEPLVKPFSLRNTSATSVVVRGVNAGCGCLLVEEGEELLLKPGETRTLRIALDPARAILGVHRYAIQAMVRGELQQLGHARYAYEPWVAITPRVIWLRPDANDPSLLLGSAAVHRMDGKPLSDLDLAGSALATMTVEPLGSESRGRLLIRVDASNADDPLTILTELRSRSNDVVPIRLVLRGHVESVVRAEPPAIVVASLPAGNRAERAVVIHCPPSRTGDLTRLRFIADNDAITTRLITNDGTPRLVVTVQPTGPGVGSATIRCTLSERVVAEIPVTWRAR